ncbi:MAG: hypothetical protein U0X93_00035 [Anaerolineales bacterium]
MRSKKIPSLVGSNCSGMGTRDICACNSCWRHGAQTIACSPSGFLRERIVGCGVAGVEGENYVGIVSDLWSAI